MTHRANNTDYIQTDRYLSEPDLRIYLDYSPSTIRRLRKRGYPVSAKTDSGGITLASVLQWLSLNVSECLRTSEVLTQSYQESEGQG